MKKQLVVKVLSLILAGVVFLSDMSVHAASEVSEQIENSEQIETSEQIESSEQIEVSEIEEAEVPVEKVSEVLPEENAEETIEDNQEEQPQEVVEDNQEEQPQEAIEEEKSTLESDLPKGMIEIDGERYYVNSDKSLATGWKTVDGNRYYFNEQGQMQTGFFQVGSYHYYAEEFAEEGEVQEIPVGAVAKGVKNIGGKIYGFHAEKYYMLTGWQTLSGGRYFFKNDCTAVIGWHHSTGDSYYADLDGRMAKGMTVIQSAEGVSRTYYFDKNNKLVTGWKKIDGEYHYFQDAETAEECYEIENSSGEKYWKILNEEEQRRSYIHPENGVYKGFKTISSQKYYFDTAGFLQTGWFEVKGVWYYAEEPVTEDEMQEIPVGALAKGLKTIDGKNYYFNKDNKLTTGWVKINGSYHFFEESEEPTACCEVILGSSEGRWVTLEDGRKSYISSKDGVYKGFKTISGQKYYFDTNGILQTGWFQVKNVWYYGEEQVLEAEPQGIPVGALAKGVKIIGEETYYFNKDYKLTTGWIKIDGVYRFFDKKESYAECYEIEVASQEGNWRILEDGRKGYITAKNGVYKGFKTIDKKKYYFDDQGIFVYELESVTGWQNFEDGNIGYIDKKGNVYTGFKTIQKQKYYFNSQGHLQTGWFSVKEKLYYGKESAGEDAGEIPVGALAKGICEIDGETYCFSTKNYYMLTGWQTVNGQRFYLDSDGTAKTGWFTLKNKTYYGITETFYDEENAKTIYRGNVLKGANQIDEDTYVFHTKNYYRLTGFQTVNGKRYYLDDDGKAMTGWFSVGTARYYGEPETTEELFKGTLASGIKEINGIRYFFHASKFYRATSWQTLNGSKYYMDSYGRVQTGWQKILWKEYFFNEDGIYMSLSAPTVSAVKSKVYASAEIKWKKVIGAAGYIVESSTSSKFPEDATNVKIVEGGNILQTTIDDLDPEAKYYFRVQYYACADEGENQVTAYSKYSKVLNTMVQGEVKATASSAEISECSIVNVARDEESQEISGIIVRIGASLKERIKSSDDCYYIVETEAYGTELDVEEPVAVLDKTFQIEAEFEVADNSDGSGNRARINQALMNKYAVAIKKADGSYQLISTPMGITNPEAVAENTADIFKASSKKGLQGVSYANDGSGILDARNANTKQTLFNIEIEDRIESSETAGFTAYEYKGNVYYFSDFSDLITNVKSLNDGYDQYIYGHDGTTKVSVTFCFLLGYKSSNSYLIDPAARTKGHKYYTLNVREEKARETYEAFFCYVGEIFGQSDCYVTNWVLGNEVNSSKAWNYSGKLSQSDYMKYYASAFRLMYNGVKTTKTGNNVFISLDNGWTAAPDTYSGKSTLDKFASYAQQENPKMLWSIAYHGYSYPLTRCDFWNDNKNTINSTSTKYISMKNISVLTNYAASLEQKYGKPEGSIRVILSEQGYNAGKGAEIQAKALARGYYMAEFNDRIDAFIIRAVIDDMEEASGGLYLGILNRYEQKRISFYVYEYMDTDLAQLAATPASDISKGNVTKVEAAQKILCDTDWEGIISGFDRNKLAGMY